MRDRRSPFRKLAVDVIRRVLRRAPKKRMGVARIRRALRDAFTKLLDVTIVVIPKRPRGVWYAAIRDVTGAGVRELRDPRQLQLFDTGQPRRRRRTARKDVTADAR